MQLDWSGIDFAIGAESDPEKIIDFWKKNNITITKTDTPQEVQSAANIYPKLFIVAFQKPSSSAPDGEKTIIGTVWGNYDGRRGYIVHLAVENRYRHLGLGRRLMDLVEKEFRKMGTYKIHLFVESHNESVGEFYSRLGFEKRTDLTIYSKTL